MEPELRKYRHAKVIDCAGRCGNARTAVVIYTFDGSRMIAADIELPEGWEYKSYGDAGGEAPFCTECLKDFKFMADAEYS